MRSDTRIRGSDIAFVAAKAIDRSHFVMVNSTDLVSMKTTYACGIEATQTQLNLVLTSIFRASA